MQNCFRRKFSKRFRTICKFSLSIITVSYVLLFSIKHFVYDPTANNYHISFKNSSVKSLSIPSQFLLIPYQEYIKRTPILCQPNILDQAERNIYQYHPLFSPYLRGKFTPILPDANITYDDIESFYVRLSTSSQSKTGTTFMPFVSNIAFEHIPYTYENGMWTPVVVKSAQRTAILVPLQGREYNAKAFLMNIHTFARRQLLTYVIIIVEQALPASVRFNKGRLLNAGVRYIRQQSLEVSCLVLHDVDLIPENDAIFYTCESMHAKHTVLRIRKINEPNQYRKLYEFLIGGVLILSVNSYMKLNGFSNSYWGWGGEDDDLSLRFIQHRMCVVRPSVNISLYAALPHLTNSKNNARFHLLTWAIVRSKQDGYRQIDSLIRIVNIRNTKTVTHIQIDVAANENSTVKLNKMFNDSITMTNISTTILKTTVLL